MRNAVILAASFCTLLSLPALAGEVAGTVYDARGQVVAGATLDLDGQQAVTAADGTYSFADVAAGEHTVVAGAQGLRVQVPAEGAVRRNVFLLSAAARTRVTGEGATPAEQARVLADARRQAARLLAEGEQLPARRLADITG